MVLVLENINNEINFCQIHFKTLQIVSLNSTEIVKWFKGLCQILTNIIKLIGDYNKNVDDKLDKDVKNTLLLYLTQMLTALSFLINVFVREEEIGFVLKSARQFISKQILHCLEGVSTTLLYKKPLEDPSGSFVKWMDLSLDKISHINPNLLKSDTIETLKLAKALFEEVLSHAMSIAQVVSPQESKIIRAGSQTVLDALNCLSEEIHKTPLNNSMVNLFVDVCSDKLCHLERKVNTAVLKLSLEVFSKYFHPLEQIHKFSFSQIQNKDDLDELVANFDLHVDQIMQIGLFAVSCSSDLNRGIKIRSCLASLEALESELVPAFNALFVDCKINSNYALVLENYWMQQANRLKHFIYLIIDPFAFCQVIYEENSEIVNDFNCLLKEKRILQLDDLQIFLNNSKVFKEFLEEALSEFQEDNIDEIKANLKDFKNVLHEVESASKILLTNSASTENSLRVVKRCKILLTVTKRLWLCFSDNNEIVEKEQSPVPPPKLGNQFFDHIIDRGKQILKDRSILYKTPTKSTIINKLNSGPLLFNKNRSFLNSKLEKKESTLNLQITEILNEITNLSINFK